MSESKGSLSDWRSPVVICFVFLALTVWSWRKWADILVDFGREMYIPWQLCAGKVLYQDVFYFNGPLSPYVNALWFKIFGVSFTTLIFCNLALLVCMTGLMFVLIKQSSDSLTATVCCLVFLCVFAFPDINGRGNNNYVCPYDHSLTHGVTLSFVMIYAFARYTQRFKIYFIIIAGVCLGLLFLTKAELFVPGVLVACTWIIINHRSNKLTINKSYKITTILLLCILCPVILFSIYFSILMPMQKVLDCMTGNWQFIFKTKVVSIDFYKQGLGVDHLFINALLMLLSFLLIMILSFLGIIADIKITKTRRKDDAIVYIVAFLIIFTLLLIINYYKTNIILFMFSKSFPLLIIAIITIYCIRYKSIKYYVKDNISIILLGAYGFFLLGKIILNVRINHYGFVLAMPATIFIIIFFIYYLPRLLFDKNGGGMVFRSLAIFILAGFSFYILLLSNIYYEKKNFAIGEGADRMLTYGPENEPFGQALGRLIQYINVNIPPNKSITVLPEGVMINYLTRRSASIPFIVFLPVELTMIGEQPIIDSLKKNPPEYILFIDRPMPEYNVPSFGDDLKYGFLIMKWIKDHYIALDYISYEIKDYLQYGIHIFKRNYEK